MRAWSVWLAVDTPVEFAEGIGVGILERLADVAAVPGAGFLNGRYVQGRIGVQLTVEAADILEAQSLAHAKVMPVLNDLIPGDLDIVHMETMTEEDFQRSVEARDSEPGRS